MNHPLDGFLGGANSRTELSGRMSTSWIAREGGANEAPPFTLQAWAIQAWMTICDDDLIYRVLECRIPT